MSSEALRLAGELHSHVHGRTEWRVQDPVSKAYCISFDRASSLNPERDAREWLSSHVSNHPNSPKAKYEVAQVHCFTELEESALKAIVILSTQAASIASLESERDQLRAELERLREFFDADMAVAKIYDEVSPGLTSPKGAEWSDRIEAAIARRCAAVIAIEAAKEAK